MPKNHGNMWKKVRLKFLLSEPLQYGANEEGVEYSEDLPRYIRITDFDGEGRLREDTKKSLEIEKANGYYLEKGDVLFARSGATVGKTFQFKNTEEPGCFAGYLIKARTERVKLHSDFLYYYTKSNEYTNWKNEIFIQATIQNIGANKYANLLVPTPSVEIQGKVISFLDQKCALIDAFIEKKQKLVKLKKEERTALINQAVTKGLDPNAPMKDSSIEWLGEIPEHWEVKKLKYVVSNVQTGVTPPSNEKVYYVNGDIDWYAPGDFNESLILKESNKKITEFAINKGVARLYEAKSVLLVGIGATIGKVGIIKKPASSNQQINAITFYEAYNPYFGAYYIRSIEDVIKKLSNSATLGIFNQSQTKNILVPVPTRGEQDLIVNYIQESSSRFEQVIANINKQIELLKEYKTTLISEAVTGKLCL